MSRYIDADALIIELMDRGIEHLQTDDFHEIQQTVNDAPTVDAVPVVRCRECKWWWKVNGLCTHPKHCHDNVCVHECGKDYFCADGERNDNETELKGEKNMEKNCKDCSKAHAIEDGVFECEADKYDINTKSCFVPKLCKIEKNQRLVEHIMEFDAQGKEYDWYEQHIALTEKGERNDKHRTDN